MFARNGSSPEVADVRASADANADEVVSTDIDKIWHGEPDDSPPRAIAPFTPAEADAHQVAWATNLDVPVEIENSIGMKFRVIPPGEFLMGSSDEEQVTLVQEANELGLDSWIIDRLPFEGPQHNVTLTKAFAMSAHEVTRGQFRQFVESTGYETDARKDGVGGYGWKDGGWAKAPEFRWNTALGFDVEPTDDLPVGTSHGTMPRSFVTGCQTQRDTPIACQRKHSGNMRAGRGRRHRFPLARRSRRSRRTMMAATRMAMAPRERIVA